MNHIDYIDIWHLFVLTFYISWGDMIWSGELIALMFDSFMHCLFMCLEVTWCGKFWITFITWIFDTFMYWNFYVSLDDLVQKILNHIYCIVLSLFRLLSRVNFESHWLHGYLTPSCIDILYILRWLGPRVGWIKPNLV